MMSFIAILTLTALTPTRSGFATDQLPWRSIADRGAR